jgi:F0F1-type ATP synthase epsilon subunit
MQDLLLAMLEQVEGFRPSITSMEISTVIEVGDEDYALAVHGGFLHVLPDDVIVLADVAERWRRSMRSGGSMRASRHWRC